jgi:predicted extracellular nuclease
MRSLRLISLAGLLLLPACSDDTDKPRPDFKIPPGTDGVVSGENVVPAEATIMDINKKVIKEGAKVTLKEVIVVAVDGYGEYTGDVYVQDPSGAAYGGLKLFAPQRNDGGGAVSDLKPGDHVSVTGTVMYFSPKSSPFPDDKKVIEIAKGGLIAKLSGGAPPPPKELTATEARTEATAVQWLHMLIKVKNEAVTECYNSTYSEFGIGKGLDVDDELFLVQPPPKFGDCVTGTGILGYFYSYKLWPRSQEDFTAGTGCPVVANATIKEIQDESSAKHPAPESPVIVSGEAVVTAVDTIATASGTSTTKYYNGFWIGDPAGGAYSGIYVYYKWHDGTAATNKPVVGNKVEVAGTYQEYQPDSKNPTKLSEISYPCVTDKGPGTLPQPAVVNPADIATNGSKVKEYEGVLVKVENVTVGAEIKTTGTTPRTVGFSLQGSNLYVENEIFDFLKNNPVVVGQTYKSITGVLHYAFGNYMLLPRSDADLVK